MVFSFLVGVSMVSGQETCRAMLDPNGCKPDPCAKKCTQYHPGATGRCVWGSNDYYCMCQWLCGPP